MRAWASPSVPSLAERGFGTGSAPTVHDTGRGGPVRLAPPEHARLYVCGITPYDATHLGHAATYLAFDLLQRVWRDAGLTVAYTQNVTDVDDPLLERAARDGIEWRDLADREVELFRSDMAALRVIAPDAYVGVAEQMPVVVAVIERLRAAGATYEVDGDLYCDTDADPGFGMVSGLDEQQMLALFGERGGDSDRPGKRHRLDWVVWRAARSGEPSWPAPFGPGRPGWHVQCAAMAVDQLGMGFEVQGGGSDLVFPHHEMSAAEAQVAFADRPFAQAYVHAGMVGLGGEKMSKSKGNLVLVSDLLGAGTDPMAVRLALLGHHYRSDWQWTDADLTAAQRRLDRWRAAARTDGAGDDPGTCVGQLRAALADDLDAPHALAVVDVWAERVLARNASGAADSTTGVDRAVEAAVDALLGIALSAGGQPAGLSRRRR